MSGSQANGFQRGDRVLSLGAREVRFRLTLGALAEICTRLHTWTPHELAVAIRAGDPKDLDALITALLRPVHGEGARSFARAVPPAPAARIIADMFEEAFA